jgi:hypothetical protein
MITPYTGFLWFDFIMLIGGVLLVSVRLKQYSFEFLFVLEIFVCILHAQSPMAIFFEVTDFESGRVTTAKFLKNTNMMLKAEVRVDFYSTGFFYVLESLHLKRLVSTTGRPSGVWWCWH